MRRVIWIAAVVSLVCAVLWARLWVSQLQVSASHTTLRMGETVQLTVSKKSWLGTEPLEHPAGTQYITNWESMAVVEPDGKVTGVGTWGESQATTNVLVYNGQLTGKIRVSLRAEGPGPSLDFIVEAAPVRDMRTATCCSLPVQVAEGHSVKFRLLRRNAQHTEVTHRSSGTRYTLFFGSGVPNDPHPSRIVGYGQSIDPSSFRVDDERGIIVAPASIGRLNRFTVLIFARNGAEVGWQQVVLVPAPVPGVQ